MDDTAPRIRMITRLSEVPEADWDRLANPVGEPHDPFLSWAFLDALETSGAATPETGWTPCHLLLEHPDGRLLGAMPLYAKTHSQGEFVFDHAWADAYERAGGQYYPKLLNAVPFTPVSGRRRLVAPGPEAARWQQTLLLGAVQLAEQNGFSSLHLNFLKADEATRLDQEGLLIRTDQQFHWMNQGYESFSDVLAAMTSAKRKTLRKERQKAQHGLRFLQLTGAGIKPEHWDIFYDFYMDTGRRKWGQPYLNRDTFALIGERMADKILLILALEDETPIAGALNLIGESTLYGRYWGCNSPRPMLHFETCYYQAIDYAIAHRLDTVEAGAQGGHKLARGYVPTRTYSAHWIAHPGLRDAIDHYLRRERAAVDQDAAYLQTRTPFKTSHPPEQDPDE